MKSQFNLSNIRAALFLFSAAFLLLVANIFVEGGSEHKSTQSRKSISNENIDSLFNNSLKNFGLPDECIIKRNRSESPYSYKIKIPQDLSIPVVLIEIKNIFSEYFVTIDVIEKSFNGLTELEISSGELTVLKAELDYDAKFKRKGKTIAFIIDEFRLLSKEDSLRLDIPEPFSLLIMPHSRSFELVKYLKDKNKTYSLLLNDDIQELKYKLDESYDSSRLKGPLVSILKDFSDAASIFIDDKSDIYNSDALSFIKNEFSKRKIGLINLSKLKILGDDNDDRIITLFDNLMKNIEGDESSVILITQEDFKILLSEIKKFKKLGYKVVHPTEII